MVIKQDMNQMQQEASPSCMTLRNSCGNFLEMTATRLPEACISLRERYVSIMDFLKVNNPSLQLQVCKDATNCFFGDFPTLSIIDMTYGENGAEAWLVPQ